ncbi:MAG: cobalamin-binding protein, partial [archaeon]|nr:cobalamin-binding protein [archaeon]
MINMDEMEQKLMDAILDFDEDDVIEQVRALKNAGKESVEIANVCRKAMDDIGRMFQEKEIFLTELIMS